MTPFICETCGVQHADGPAPPAQCAICADERQYLGPQGQRWTTLDDLRALHENTIVEVEPDLFQIGTTPEFAIGQHAFLVRTPSGNVLWDCISLIDDATEERLRKLGGVAAIAISHPHFYASCVEWSRSFDAPIFLPEVDRPFMMRPDAAVTYYDHSPDVPVRGVRVVQVGGHFRGSAILHWADGAEGQGVVLSGDSIAVAADRSSVTFMYSYPNTIPLSAVDVRTLTDRVTALAFDRLYAAWPGDVIGSDARAVVRRSAERYIGMLEGTWPRH